MAFDGSNRIIILVDMDCFYVQVEQVEAPEYLGKPAAVVQYNPFQGGGIIAVNYEARDFGVTRQMRGDEAKKHCPNLHLFRVPETRGKANITKYREAGAEVMKVLTRFGDCVERASVDEAYLDVTKLVDEKMDNITTITAEMLPNTFVVGFEDATEDLQSSETMSGIKHWLTTACLLNQHDRRLAIAGVLAEEIRATVYSELKYRCSAGIAHNKVLAKLTCGLHKPNKQTLLPQEFVAHLFQTVPIHKVRSLGGKMGEEVKTKLNIKLMSELSSFSEQALQKHFGEKLGSYLFKLAKGIDNDPVTPRQLSKSIGCGKNFPGKTSLSTRDEVSKWVGNLTEELLERLEKDKQTNKRIARLLTITISRSGDSYLAQTSRSVMMTAYNELQIKTSIMKTLEKLNTSNSADIWQPSITKLFIVAGKFQDCLETASAGFRSFFNTLDINKVSSSALSNITVTRVRNSDENRETAKESSFIDVCATFASKICSASEFEPFDNDLGACKSEQNAEFNMLGQATSSTEEVKFKQTIEVFDESSRKSISDSSTSPSKGFFAQRAKIAHENAKTESPVKSKSEQDKNNIGSFELKKIVVSFDNEKGEKRDSNGLCPQGNSVKNESNKKLDGIAKYFSIKNETVPSDISDVNADTASEEFSYKCPECTKVIPWQNVDEHTDYHFALNIEKQWKQGQSTSGNLNTKVPKRQTNSKRTPLKTKKRKLNTRPLEFYLRDKS